MITTNKDLRIDTFDGKDLAYLVSSPNRYEICREVSTLLFDIKLNPVSKSRFITEGDDVNVATREKLLDHRLAVRVGTTDKAKPDNGNKYNWRLASEYLKRTYDYPFFNYSTDGWRKDSNMMSNYLSEETEQQRFKSVTGASYEPHILAANETLNALCINREEVGLTPVFNMVVATFGTQSLRDITGSKPISRKCIPSGGGRHPTEAYVIEMDGHNAFHYCSGNNSFANLGADISRSTYRDAFGEPEKYVTFPVKYIIVLTSIWERNMFRYREPKTFRSVHLDAGHAVSNLEILAEKAGYLSKVQYGLNSKRIEELFHLNPLEEGVMCALMLGVRKQE